MKCIILTRTEAEGLQCRDAVENLGEDWRCLSLQRADAARTALRSHADVLLLLPGGESQRLLEEIGQHPLLAPPYLLGLGMDAPDGCLSTLSALPGLLTAWRHQLHLPAEAPRCLPMTADIAGALFRTMEVPARLRAWTFLPEMAALTVVHPPLLTDLKHGLYPLVAQRCGMTPAGVERSLRLCVESTWMHGSLAALERFFGSSVDPERGKPTNREFLCRVQERLTLSMQRLV